MLRVYRRFIISTSHTFNLRHNFPQISHFSTSSSSSSNDFTDFLENSLGFSHQQSITLSTKLPSYNTRFSNASKNAVSVVNINDVVKNLSLNVALLTSYGVPIDSIRKHLAQQPGLFLRNPDTFKDVVIRVVEKIGNLPNSTMFLYGLRLFLGCSEEKIESKCRVFRSFGWTQTDIETLMMKNALVFNCSEENIKKKLGFLMNDVGLEAAFLTSNSCLLTNSLEKKLLPRHNVLQILKAEGLLLKFPRFNSVVNMSESLFIKKFVLPFKDVHQVYARHVGCSVETLLQEHASDPR